jgi:hypothetical protein
VPITIDPANKRFVLDSTSVTAKAIYVAWVDWVALSDNAKYLPAFRTAGGDDLGSGLSIPPYYFLLNGWRVRPMEANQTLVIDGNLFVDGGGDPIVATLGVFQVLVKSVVPVQAQGISTSGSTGPTAADIAAEVWMYLNRTLTSAGSSAPTAAENAAAVLAAAQATPIHADAKRMNGATIFGTGAELDLWRGA